MIHRVTCAIAQSARHIFRQPFFVFYDEDSHIVRPQPSCLFYPYNAATIKPSLMSQMSQPLRCGAAGAR